jgi:pilus assembly protein CpaB
MTTVALAGLLAVIGIVAVLAYVSQANNRAMDGIKAVSTLVAKDTIPEGTSVKTAQREGLLISETLPASTLPADYIPKVTSDIANRVTNATLQKGEVLLGRMLVTTAQVTGPITIPPGDMAVTVLVCLPEDVAGYVRVGSRVALFDTYSNASMQRTCDVTHQTENPTTVHTSVILANVQVLSVSAAPASQSTTAGSTILAGNASGSASQGTVEVTLAVNQGEAEHLILTAETGLPYLALVTDPAAAHIDYKP